MGRRWDRRRGWPDVGRFGGAPRARSGAGLSYCHARFRVWWGSECRRRVPSGPVNSLDDYIRADAACDGETSDAPGSAEPDEERQQPFWAIDPRSVCGSKGGSGRSLIGAATC